MDENLTKAVSDVAGLITKLAGSACAFLALL
jgi:hypothetical protein